MRIALNHLWKVDILRNISI